jgi:hypothetical protein
MEEYIKATEALDLRLHEPLPDTPLQKQSNRDRKVQKATGQNPSWQMS